MPSRESLASGCEAAVLCRSPRVVQTVLLPGDRCVEDAVKCAEAEPHAACRQAFQACFEPQRDSQVPQCSERRQLASGGSEAAGVIQAPAGRHVWR